MIEALERKRVLLGFPGAASVPHEEAIRYVILDRREQPTTIGELDGSQSTRIQEFASALQSAGFPTSICSNMDAWLKTHAAEIVPTAAVFYMAECDIGQLQKNKEALALMVQAIREGHRVLSAIGVPITPSSHRLFTWIPKPLLVLAIRRKLQSSEWKIKIGHAAAAQDEMDAIADDLHDLAQRASIITPAFDQLRLFLAQADQRPRVRSIAVIDA
ncbi:2-dehydropantoate 2-reductase [Stieleria bergensis]|uniref:2-dehydropantoate 2-reductase n=1 Tax=Stieleria bergensis TaxID=2528025 RepID=A0A517SZA7_9BACT|nr:2-dehydropantoate 2-reductase [Planctomycetes bacterium SV_7m_r]